jgi:hypothetical protein
MIVAGCCLRCYLLRATLSPCSSHAHTPDALPSLTPEATAKPMQATSASATGFMTVFGALLPQSWQRPRESAIPANGDGCGNLNWQGIRFASIRSRTMSGGG